VASASPFPLFLSPAGVDDVVANWLGEGSVRRCLAAEKRFSSTEARYADMPPGIAPALRAALAQRGQGRLYTHQAAAVARALDGGHVVLATPTASGKSLCFNLPVLTALAADPSARALFVYPTKALSRDQEHNLRALIHDAGLGLSAVVYDGDTPGSARRVAREQANVLLTNPDMLHSGILPSHARWADTFENLRYVVLDELHTYRGVFGSHMSHVLSRLRRIARFHGSDPTFIAATATIGNPREHAARLLGVEEGEVTLIDESGAPRAARQLFVYNPPVVNVELGIRRSMLKESVRLASDLVRARVPSIVFGPSRNSVEVMLKYLRERVGAVAGPEAIMGYRGGYLPETRRSIERGLRDGKILCVVATNALELGIDIGDLDAVVCAGYPGSVAGLWQRFGRAGRRGSTSIAVLVCSSTPLDQYLARDPAFLLEAGVEEARIDPNNLEIVVQHLKCACFEIPFRMAAPGPRPARPEPAAGERYAALDVAATRDALEYLAGHGLLHAAGSSYHWAGDAFPANHVSLRNIGWDNFVIVDVATERLLGELDWRAAHTMLHEQAIYQQDAEQYQVERLDYENRKAFVRKVAPDYFTTALTYRSVTVLEQSARASLGDAALGWGEIKVVEKVTGYKKIKFFTHENAGYGDVHLPELEMHTLSFWLTLSESVLKSVKASRAEAIDGLRGLGNALETVAALSLMCDPRDLGQTLGDGARDPELGVPAGRDFFAGHSGKFDPTVFLFDAHPGGVGLAPRIFDKAAVLLDRARALVEGCPCETGCPACVGPATCGRRKELSLELLGRVLAG
jgi:DEAD/DEAH box helicase domain-containing protein